MDKNKTNLLAQIQTLRTKCENLEKKEHELYEIISLFLSWGIPEFLKANGFPRAKLRELLKRIKQNVSSGSDFGIGSGTNNQIQNCPSTSRSSRTKPKVSRKIKSNTVTSHNIFTNFGLNSSTHQNDEENVNEIEPEFDYSDFNLDNFCLDNNEDETGNEENAGHNLLSPPTPLIDNCASGDVELKFCPSKADELILQLTKPCSIQIERANVPLGKVQTPTQNEAHALEPAYTRLILSGKSDRKHGPSKSQSKALKSKSKDTKSKSSKSRSRKTQRQIDLDKQLRKLKEKPPKTPAVPKPNQRRQREQNKLRKMKIKEKCATVKTLIRIPKSEPIDDDDNVIEPAESKSAKRQSKSKKTKKIKIDTESYGADDEIQNESFDLENEEIPSQSLDLENEAETEPKTKQKRTKESRGPLTCPICQKIFDRPSHFQRHSRIHTGEKPFLCDQCPATFRHPLSLQRHKFLHSGEKPFVCEVCGKGFRQLGNLKIHKDVHNEEEIYECEICSKKFKTFQTKRFHIRKDHPQPQSQSEPMPTTNEEHPEVPFPILSKYEVGEALEVQIGVELEIGSSPAAPEQNQNIKNFSCETCGKAFALKGNLVRHALLHTGLKPFNCMYCELSYVRKDRMKEHYRSAHRDQAHPSL